jgi:hypothetical protein
MVRSAKKGFDLCPWLLLAGQPAEEVAEQGVVARPGHEVGRAPVGGAVGGEGGAAAFTVVAGDQQGVGVAADEDLSGGLGGQLVVAEQGRPVERDAIQDRVDALVVYADREHFANLSYLTGYDPQFEESLLILVPGRAPVLLVGNEGLSYAAVVPPGVEVVLYQSFSLVSQDRSASPRLSSAEADQPSTWVDAPSFIVDTLRELGCVVLNATGLFTMPGQCGIWRVTIPSLVAATTVEGPCVTRAWISESSSMVWRGSAMPASYRDIVRLLAYRT